MVSSIPWSVQKGKTTSPDSSGVLPSTRGSFSPLSHQEKNLSVRFFLLFWGGLLPKKKGANCAVFGGGEKSGTGAGKSRTPYLLSGLEGGGESVREKKKPMRPRSISLRGRKKKKQKKGL